VSTVIEVRDAEKRYRGNTLFAGANFDIRRGVTYALRGPNGSGKSVLLQMLCRIVVPDRGSVTIDKAYLDKGRVYPDRFGVTIDGPAYLSHVSGYANLLDLARVKGRIGPEEIAGSMKSFGLDPNNKKPVRTYSTGMKQKLALCQATMEDQDVLILDEPFNGLDASSTESLISRLQDYKSAGKTIILTSHESAHLRALADQTLTIDAETVTLTEEAPNL